MGVLAKPSGGLLGFVAALLFILEVLEQNPEYNDVHIWQRPSSMVYRDRINLVETNDTYTAVSTPFMLLSVGTRCTNKCYTHEDRNSHFPIPHTESELSKKKKKLSNAQDRT